MRKVLLPIGGSISFLFSLLHLSFWKMGNWKEELLRISYSNKGIVQMLNVVSIYTLLFAAFISFYLSQKPEFTFAERALIVFIAGYYILRVAFGIPFFEVVFVEVVVWIFCLAAAACHLLALRRT